MGLIRCTCLYRAATAAERADGLAAIAVSVIDPLCPSAQLHDRLQQQATARTSARHVHDKD